MATKEWREKNKDKIRVSRRKWYHNNKEKAYKAVKDRRQELKKWFIDIRKDLFCVVCQEEETCCLDFHHRDPKSKEKCVARMILDGWSKKRVLEEIDKCDVVCSNCHRKIHAGLINIGA